MARGSNRAVASLGDLTAGTPVYVVWQRDTRSKSQAPRKAQVQQVTKVGKKYVYLPAGTILRGGDGKSHHAGEYGSNVRANCGGFDVYLCEEDYLCDVKRTAEVERLIDRLYDIRTRYYLRRLPIEAVEQIHALLDSSETKKD